MQRRVLSRRVLGWLEEWGARIIVKREWRTNEMSVGRTRWRLHFVYQEQNRKMKQEWEWEWGFQESNDYVVFTELEKFMKPVKKKRQRYLTVQDTITGERMQINKEEGKGIRGVTQQLWESQDKKKELKKIHTIMECIQGEQRERLTFFRTTNSRREMLLLFGSSSCWKERKNFCFLSCLLELFLFFVVSLPVSLSISRRDSCRFNCVTVTTVVFFGVFGRVNIFCFASSESNSFLFFLFLSTSSFTSHEDHRTFDSPRVQCLE